MRIRDLLPSLDRTLLGFDLETTHTNPKVARIVSLGLEIMKPGEPTREYRTLVNPGIPIPKESSDIHGILDEHVQDAPTFERLADKLLKGFTDADFGGFNVRFDLRIIAAEFARARRTWSYDGARIIDFFRVWQVAEPRSLDDAVEHWINKLLRALQPELADDYLREIAEAGKSHDAMRDVIASTRVGAAQFIVCGDRIPRDVQQLHDLCWPGWFDSEGKLQWRNGQLCIMFGQHREKSLREVPRDYLHWMARKGDFSPMVKATCAAALDGVFPEPVKVSADEDLDDEI